MGPLAYCGLHSIPNPASLGHQTAVAHPPLPTPQIILLAFFSALRLTFQRQAGKGPFLLVRKCRPHDTEVPL